MDATGLEKRLIRIISSSELAAALTAPGPLRHGVGGEAPRSKYRKICALSEHHSEKPF
jgi:hypothetical protein